MAKFFGAFVAIFCAAACNIVFADFENCHRCLFCADRSIIQFILGWRVKSQFDYNRAEELFYLMTSDKADESSNDLLILLHRLSKKPTHLLIGQLLA